MESKHPQKWNYSLSRFFGLPGGDDEFLLAQNSWLGIAASTSILALIAMIVYACMGHKLLAYMMAGLCAYFLVSGGLYLRIRRHAEQFFIAAEVFKMLFSFAAVLVTGGIMNSGGLVFIGFAGIYFALVFPDPGKVRYLLLLYLFTLFLEALLQPCVTPLVWFSETQNLTLFVLYFMATAITLYFFLRIYIKERMRFRQLEAEKLRNLDATRSRFFTNISHEFRTPLMVILGMADQIRETPAPQASQASRLIQRNGKKLLRLVDQVLDLSRLEAGRLPVEYVQDDIVAELRYLLESFHSLAETKHIRLHFSSHPDEIVMDFDPEKLEHLVSNLLDNAIKYTPAGGEVRLEALQLAEVPATLDATQECLLLQVKDSGIGIPAQHLGRIFERYYQVGEWPVEGSGIGLALVKEYVRLLDGHIEVDSRPGEGSIFSVFLPIKNTAPRRVSLENFQTQQLQPEEKTPLSPAETTDGAHTRLLIIEDNPDVIHYLQHFLRNDYHLLTAFDGEQGIAMAIERVPDIIISDIMMPKSDGVEVCKTLKNDFRTNHIPIILLTAKTDVTSRIAGLEAGADAYLAKPFHRRELEVELKKLTVLRETLRRKYSHHLAQPLPSGPPKGLNERFLYDVQKCLERHYQDEEFGIPSLCSMTSVSRTQLHRKLMALTGQSASHFIRSFRLGKAHELLRTTRMTVGEVAYAVGFKDSYYFSRTFAQEYGHAPSEAREG
jgi:signal transduction histidine kinase/CheY-like chemotaxis protein